MSNLNTIITAKARENMAKARAGLITLPTIAGMAFGDGGADSGGTVIPPTPGQTALRSELARKAISSTEMISATTCRYKCILGTSELVGESISEIALYDTEGDLMCIKSFIPKGKDAETEQTYVIDDAF